MCETWNHKDGTFWLRDLLPRSLPGARVFAYGYPSDIFLDRSVAHIRVITVNLLDAVESRVLRVLIDAPAEWQFSCACSHISRGSLDR